MSSHSLLERHLRALEEQLLDPQTRADPSAVARLLTDGFREFGSSGRSYTKPEILQALADEPAVDLHLTEFACELAGSTVALVTYRSHRTTAEGHTTTALRSSLWVRQEDGDWRLHFHQGTTLR